MKSIIYILDTYTDYANLRETDYNIQFIWQERARHDLMAYAEKHNIDIEFVTNTHPYIEKFRSITEELYPQREDFWKLEKFIRWNIFADSEYDYAYFVDLDTIILNEDVNIDDVIDPNKFYCNSFGRGREDWNRKMNAIRKDRVLFYSKQPERLWHFSSGFMAANKKHADNIISALDDWGLNLMTEEGIHGLIEFLKSTGKGRRGMFTDEVVANMVLNADIVSPDEVSPASADGLCEEFWISNRDSVFFHVIGNDFDKQRTMFLLHEFLREYKTGNK